MIKLIIFLVIVIVLIIVLIIFKTMRIAENFDVYNTCINRGYPYKWRLDSPYEINTCSCPPGLNLIKRYGRCYCRS